MCIRILCIVIILICLVSFILFCYEKEKKTLSNLIKIQLTITCFLHFLSYIFPPVRPFFCEHWWGGVAIVNIITSPLFVIVFILNEDGKMKTIKDML